jgi:hypothetical protein
MPILGTFWKYFVDLSEDVFEPKCSSVKKEEKTSSRKRPLHSPIVHRFCSSNGSGVGVSVVLYSVVLVHWKLYDRTRGMVQAVECLPLASVRP